MAKQMKVEISSPKGLNGEWLYASLDLPAEEHEIRDAYHRARVMSHEDERYLSVYDCDAFPMLSFVRLETEGIDELNFLAQRLDSLEEHEIQAFLIRLVSLLCHVVGVEPVGHGHDANVQALAL